MQNFSGESDPRPRVVVDDAFMDRLGPAQAWFAGLIAADGYVRKDRYVGLAQSGDPGRHLVEHVASLLSYTGQIRTAPTARQPSHRIWFNSRRIGAALADLGIRSPKSLTLTFPSVFTGDLALDFLRGYIEGDGSVAVYRIGRTNSLCLSFVGTESFMVAAVEHLPIGGTPLRLRRAANCFELRWTGKKAALNGMCLWGRAGLYEGRKSEMVWRWANFDRRPCGANETLPPLDELPPLSSDFVSRPRAEAA